MPAQKKRENHSLGDVPSQQIQQQNVQKNQTQKQGTPSKENRKMSPNRQFIQMNNPSQQEITIHQKNQSINNQKPINKQTKSNSQDNYIQKNEILRQQQLLNSVGFSQNDMKSQNGQNTSHKKQWSAITILPTQIQQQTQEQQNRGQNPLSSSQNFTGFDMKQSASAAPASGVNSSINQYQIQNNITGQQFQINHNPSLSQNSFNVTGQSQDLSGTLSNKNVNKQIPLRQAKVRNQNVIINNNNNNEMFKIIQNKIDNSSYHKKQYSSGTVQHKQQSIDSKANNKNNELIQKSTQNQDDLLSDGKEELIEKQGQHQRKDARIPSANKIQAQRIPSGKRVPSAQRLKKQIEEQQKQLIAQIKYNDKEQESKKEMKTKQTPKNEQLQKEVMLKEVLNTNIKQGNSIFEKTRSSINNIKRSRNEAKNALPANTMPSDTFDPAENPTSAGQSTSSLYKQEQIRQKFKVNVPQGDLNEQQESSQEFNIFKTENSNITKQENNKENQIKINKILSPKNIQNDEKKSVVEKVIEQKPEKLMNNTFTPNNRAQIKEEIKKNIQQNNFIEQPNKIEEHEVIQNPKNETKNALANQQNGLTGRNLYFNQIRNEINLSETNKIKGLPDYQNAKYSNKRNGLVAGYGANTNQGIVRNYNEDRVAIILNIMKPKSKNYENQSWPKCSFFGIYDGHGGAVCADFLRDYLHQFIIKDENFPQNPIQALRNGFREAERLFIEFAESQEKEAGEIDRSGSCAVVILIIDDMCYCANTGDSRSIMSADGGEKLFLLSTDHKPTDEIEMKRIIEGGGRIYQNSQIIQTNPSLGEQGKQVVYGPHRVFPGRLSVSRTIGDIEAKVEKYEGNPNVVIADPDVTAFEIKENHDFIIIGCDGVFDKLSSKDAIHIAWQKVLMECSKQNIKKVDLEQTHKNCGHCVDGILRISALRRTVDNVTCVVVAFDGFQKQLQKFIDNNQDGTTVDVIEEIQLEPIPEYLSNTKAKKNENTMLLLDENINEIDNPLFLKKQGNQGMTQNILKTDAKINHLSEIAEEDDISGVSENIKDNIQDSTKKKQKKDSKGNYFMEDGSLGEIGKISIHSDNIRNIDKISIHENEINQAKQVDLKRRSQILPYKSVSDQVSQSISDFSEKNIKQVKYQSEHLNE